MAMLVITKGYLKKWYPQFQWILIIGHFIQSTHFTHFGCCRSFFSVYKF